MSGLSYKMTLREFIGSGGIPARDTFSQNLVADLHERYFDCIADNAYLNRAVKCGPFIRLRRKLYYDHGIGQLPLKHGSLNQRYLFWGDGIDPWLKSLDSLFHRLARIQTENYYSIIIESTDDSFTRKMAERIPSSVSKIFATNCRADHPKVQWYPLGRDPQNAGYFNIPPLAGKQKLVYSNFSLATHEVRRKVYDLVSGKEFVNTVKIDGYGFHLGYPMSQEQFVAELNNHAFSICPRGRGVDTLRMWESLHLGVVPIVVREAKFQDHLACLPILFLDKVDDYGDLRQDLLEQKRVEMLDTEYDFSILTTSYWNSIFREGM